MLQLSKTEQVLHEMRNFQLDILALSEVRWTGSGKNQLDNQCANIYSGPETRHEKGFAFMTTRETSRYLLKWTLISSRILVARFLGRQEKLSVVFCYAPTNLAVIEYKVEFYQTLQSLVNSILKHDTTCILGDLNPVVGKTVFIQSSWCEDLFWI
ncbi:craniofacial development protein 2-like [Artemia franciscana]|uniref:craniofacial development protein 2-like n=1 Tax=Artemia franciscana TaxID=6661 RepID=UPI0032D9D38C